MGKFLRILEQNDPDRTRYAANSGKYAIKDALEAQGIPVQVDPYNSTLSFSHNGFEFTVTVKELGPEQVAGPEEEQESISPEDQAIQDEINSLKMADSATNNDPNVQRVKRDLSSKVGNAYSKISQSISRI
jgi:hypothetical protein